jgi:hypothetical protein
LNEIDRLMRDQFVAEMFEKTVGKAPSTRTSRNGKLDAPKPLSAKRIKNVMGTLRTILGTAHRWGVLDKVDDVDTLTTGVLEHEPEVDLGEVAIFRALLEVRGDSSAGEKATNVLIGGPGRFPSSVGPGRSDPVGEPHREVLDSRSWP